MQCEKMLMKKNENFFDEYATIAISIDEAHYCSKWWWQLLFISFIIQDIVAKSLVNLLCFLDI